MSATALRAASTWMRLFLLITAIMLGSPVAWGIDLGAEDHEVHVDAQEISYDQVAETLSASGSVLIRRGELQLHADEVRISRDPIEADAKGNVELTTPNGLIRADHIYFNLDDETGSLRNVSIQAIESRFSLFGAYAEKRSGQCYRIEKGEFTTCRCPDGPPTWTISTERLDLDLNGYGTVRRGRFNLHGWPVLAIPWAMFPVSNERQSGLLEPRFAFSNRRGLQILQPAYWAINKSHDATVAFDVESSARLGLVGEHRYAASRNISGEWTATYFNEAIRGNPDGLSLRSRIPENRWSLRADHRHRRLAGGTLYVDAFLISDDGFLREINAMSTDYTRDVALRTLQFTESRVGYVRSWERHAVRVESVYYQDIDLTGIVRPTPSQNGDDPSPDPTPARAEVRRSSQTIQKLPSIEWRGQGRLAGTLLGDASASLVDFQRGEGSDGLRLDIEPALAIPLPLGPYAFGSLQASARETAYHLFQRDELSTLRLSQNPTRETVQVRGQLGTALARVYRARDSSSRAWQHLIEPRIEYLFSPSVDDDELPLFDARDRARPRNLVTYGLSTSVTSRRVFSAVDQTPERSMALELARIWIQQSVDLERRVPSVSANAERDDHFSDIELGGAMNPWDGIAFDFSSQLDHGAGALTAAKVGVFLEDRRAADAPGAMIRSRARIAYRFLTGNALQEVHGDMLLRITSWLGFSFATRYDVVENLFLDRHFGLRVLSRCDCWALDLGVTDRTNPREVEGRIRFTLLGIMDGGLFGAQP